MTELIIRPIKVLSPEASCDCPEHQEFQAKTLKKHRDGKNIHYKGRLPITWYGLAPCWVSLSIILISVTQGSTKMANSGWFHANENFNHVY